jgi:F0F1-type ATP synthase assembly protein I
MENDAKKPFWQALSYAWQFGYTIAIPLVVLALGGRLLDKKLGTTPWLFITGIIISIFISSTALIMKATRIFAQIDKEAKSARGGSALGGKDKEKKQ